MTRTRRQDRPVIAPSREDQAQAQAARRRKPRLMVAGEFSAGKTRLVTGLIGAPVLPSGVTATALPPVWLIGGPEACYLMADGAAPRPLERLDQAVGTRRGFCVASHPAPILRAFDLIDTPGSSDPGLPADGWAAMLDHADAVIWCTNATQAWRQSEKAIWQEMPQALRKRATLVVTHADHMPDQRSAERVLRRVEREAGPFFDTILMVSALDRADIARLAAHLGQLAEGLTPLPGTDHAALEALRAAPPPRAEGAARAVTPRRIRTGPAQAQAQAQSEMPQTAPAQSPATAPPSQPQPAQGATLHRLPPAAPQGRHRALWAQLSQQANLDDPKALMAAIDRLIDLLDAQTDRQTTAPAPPVPSADETAAMIRNMMSGSLK